MQKFKRILLIVGEISFSILLTFSSLSCFSQNLTTVAPYGTGMTDNLDFYVFFDLNNESRISLAMAFTNDSIHVCPYIVNTPNKFLFDAVSGLELAHYFNYVSHGEVIKTGTLKKELQPNDYVDSVYWKTSPDLKNIVYQGYDGSSVEKAIIIKKAANLKEGIAAEYSYLERELGQRGIIWKPLGQYLHPVANKRYDIIKVKIINTNEIKYFCFDITKFFGKF
jgi:hypothetical protein